MNAVMAHAATAPLLSTPAPPVPPRWNTFAFVCAALASMTTILLGYNLALMSGAELFIREDLGLSDTQVEVLSGSINVFMLVSILAAGWAADALGRRGTLVLANVFFIAGALAMSMGGDFAQLVAARFVTSVGCGFARVVAPVYNAEISPDSMRGVLTCLLDIFINVGMLLAYVSNYAFAGLPARLGWRVMFAVGVAPPVLLAAAVLAMPESPRWLVLRGRHAEARAVLVRTSDSDAADLRLEEIKRAVTGSTPPGNNTTASGGWGVWREMLFSPSASVRRAVAIVVGLQFFHHASGTEAIILYSPLIFKHAGMSSTSATLGATVALGTVKTCFILVATLLSDRVGRRPLLLFSTAGVALAQAAIAVTLCIRSAGVTVVFVLAFVASFSVGLGPLVSTYNAEVMPLRLRAQGASLGMVVNRVTCSVVSMTFISLANWITMPGCFVLYTGAEAVGCAFVYALVPETKGRSLENMEVLFADDHDIRGAPKDYISTTLKMRVRDAVVRRRRRAPTGGPNNSTDSFDPQPTVPIRLRSPATPPTALLRDREQPRRHARRARLRAATPARTARTTASSHAGTHGARDCEEPRRRDRQDDCERATAQGPRRRAALSRCWLSPAALPGRLLCPVRPPQAARNFHLH